jgi:hypothetical protein
MKNEIEDSSNGCEFLNMNIGTISVIKTGSSSVSVGKK